jgi:ubiquinone/menaquinone biosynthesis C-methylase UbiE
MVEYFHLLTHKNPQMNILEVGAGTGSATVHIFNALGNNARDLIHKYHYTDISSGFFEQGRTLLEKWTSLLKFQVLDVTKDPLEQGFEPHSFDLVVASNVIHATPSIHETLAGVRKLLKPGGRMLLLEISRNTAMVSTIFGALPG